MDEYTKRLYEEFSGLKIDLVSHDMSAHGMPCYIQVHLGKAPKDKGTLALDLGNYIHRVLGLRYQYCPEYLGRGKTLTIRYFMSWSDLEPIRGNVLRVFSKERMLKVERYLPFEFNRLSVQNPKADWSLLNVEVPS